MTARIDWSAPGAMDAWEAACAEQRAVTAATGKSPMERAFDGMQERVYGPVEAMIAGRAARYRRNAALLIGHLADVGITGTGRMTTDELVARIDAEIAARVDEPRRYVGFGGETLIINLKAARRHVLTSDASEREVA